MRYLLDTSIFLWMIAQPDKLNAKARKLLSAAETELYLSAASCWEIVIKVGVGRLELDAPPAQYIPRWQSTFNIRPLAISQMHALELSELPANARHKDPFDRMLIAQARTEKMLLLTSDLTVTRFATNYAVETFWCGK
ncbi:MAG: PilT-like protein [Candidatus Angelobacter sp.]|jgi:PIN domain nuclease of toxin-antitoxin system|nr:PilT-like protein [Candidatus Angelobacter sp.]